MLQPQNPMPTSLCILSLIVAGALAACGGASDDGSGPGVSGNGGQTVSPSGGAFSLDASAALSRLTSGSDDRDTLVSARVLVNGEERLGFLNVEADEAIQRLARVKVDGSDRVNLELTLHRLDAGDSTIFASNLAAVAALDPARKRIWDARCAHLTTSVDLANAPRKEGSVLVDPRLCHFESRQRGNAGDESGDLGNSPGNDAGGALPAADSAGDFTTVAVRAREGSHGYHAAWRPVEDGLNCRTGPGTNYPVFAVVGASDRLVAGTSQNPVRRSNTGKPWLRLKTPAGKVCYVRAHTRFVMPLQGW